MKAAFLLVALATTVLAQDISVFGHFYQTSQNTWSKQAIFVQNNDLVAANDVNRVWFEILVSAENEVSDRLGVFYGYRQPVGVVGSIAGGANGTGYFYVNGDAGTYTVNAVVAYEKDGITRFFVQPLTFSIGGAQTAWAREELVEESEEAAMELIEERDGSNTDMGAVASSGITSLHGVAGQSTWNNYKMKAGASKLTNVAVTYSLVTGDQQTAFFWVDANASSVWNANGQYSLNFAINGPSSGSSTWVLKVTFNYNKCTTTACTTTTPGSWNNNYNFYITANKKRSVEEVKSMTVLAIEAAQEAEVRSSKFGVALGAAGAAVAVVAVVAVVVALVSIRRNKQAQITA